VDSFGINYPLSSVREGTNLAGAMIEGKSFCAIADGNEKATLDKLIGGNYAVIDALCSYVLPTIARNQLDNGKSNNLWYEEFVPRESIFYFIVLIPDNEENELPIDGEVIQFGGNASVGYGYCKLTKVGDSFTELVNQNE
jgi:CRISPR-associated protein Cmr4